jgi:mRNA-degrading endonuclease HigB of HigAB toxin-antitoxin module
MNLKIIETKKFKKLKKSLIQYSSITESDIEEVKELFSTKLFKAQQIRPHPINCGKDKLVSLSIPNTQYRILCYLTCKPKIAIFGWIGTHKEYEIIIKNSKNCKNYIFECENIMELLKAK